VRYNELGYRPVPVRAGSKAPSIRGWPNYQSDADDFSDGMNIGIILGAGLVCVDLDHQTVLELAEGILPRQKAVNAAASNNKGM